MGRKVHPTVFRTGVIYSWPSKWFAAKKDYPKILAEDIRLKEFLAKKLKEASVDRFEIERTLKALTITIHTAKPGFIIGRGGTGVEELKKKIKEMLGRDKASKTNLNLNIVEVTNPSLSSNIIRQSMIGELERRMPFRRVLKTHLDRIQKAGAKGAKIMVSGRLNGADIAREEKVSWGKVPLQNLRADIDFSSGPARTIFGTIGVKVWIYRGDVFGGELPKIEAPRGAFARGGNRGGRDGGRGPRRDDARGGNRGGRPSGRGGAQPTEAKKADKPAVKAA
jgi:small subunit ribosomal protein S3